MTELYERVAQERKRLRQVRELLTAATAQKAGGDAAFVPFYTAIADYFEAAMERLHAQDIRMGGMLQAKADMQDPLNQQALKELKDRLAGNQAHLKKMLAARELLATEGAAALPAFESAGGGYAAYIVANMGHHPGSTNLARTLFSVEDWAWMADASEADQDREQALFAKVFAALPESLHVPEQG